MRMIKVRYGQFETNSSSTHAMIVCNEEPKNIPPFVYFGIGDFGWRRDLLKTPEEKAAYLYTSALCLYGDKNIEVLFVNIQDSIQMLNSNIRTIKNIKIWPMFLSNPQHTSSFSINSYKNKYKNMIYFGCILLVLYCFLKFRGMIRKSKKRVKVTYL